MYATVKFRVEKVAKKFPADPHEDEKMNRNTRGR